MRTLKPLEQTCNPSISASWGHWTPTGLGRIYPIHWIEIEIGIAIGIQIPIPIAGMTHPNRPGYLVDAVR